MYTDTKNLMNANIVDMTYTRTQTSVTVKPKGRLRKAWKPLLRFLTHKPERNGSCNKYANNHLNNSNNTTNEKELSDSFATLTVQVPPKAAPFEHELDQQWSEQIVGEPAQTKQAHTAVIKSASIDKEPNDTCYDCTYGRNCQHNLHQSSHTNAVAYPLVDNNMPLSYIHTIDDNFAWNGTEAKIDEDLLNAWYYYNYRQAIVHTQASLC